MRQGIDLNVKDQISKKNREISIYIDEIRVCMLTVCITAIEKALSGLCDISRSPIRHHLFKRSYMSPRKMMFFRAYIIKGQFNLENLFKAINLKFAMPS